MTLGFILWVLVGFSLAHPFHVSVCDVEHDPETKALQITHHIFLDDIEEALHKKFDPRLDIVHPANSQKRDEYVKTYVMEHFQVKVNDKVREGNYLGHEIEEDAIFCYIEITGVKKFSSISVTNTMLTELFNDQINLVHIKVDGKIRSLKLDKKNPSGQIDYSD